MVTFKQQIQKIYFVFVLSPGFATRGREEEKVREFSSHNFGGSP